ncbi:MAG: stalk domain-containing protein [Defluviitaleaceae bacterium]|nr:stalk domain-containing protein [Defluviitaleaceae bacterium]
MRILLPLAVIVVLYSLAYGTAAESRIIIDGTVVNAIAHDDMLPLREVVEHIGGAVSWNRRSQQVTINHGSQTIVVTVGSRSATINNNPFHLSSSPQIINGQVMMPVDFFAYQLGLGTGYINSSFILSTTPATSIPVLVYHHILPDEVNIYFTNNAWTISTQNFTQQMQFLSENGFYTPTLNELEAFLYYGRPLPQNSIMIHFDDGYYSNYVYALPILQKYGLRAVLFPITGNASALGETQPSIDHTRLTHTSASTLRTGLDIFETASHSHTLHDRAPDSNNQTLLVVSTHETIVTDTVQSFNYLTNHRAYAYPLGMFNDTVIYALQEAGITMAFTVNTGYITQATDPFRLPRFTIYQDTALTRFQMIANRRA